MNFLFIRIFFLIMSGIVGYQIGSIGQKTMLGIGFGLAFGFILIMIESNLRQVSVRGLSSVVFGLLLGVFMAKLVSDILLLLPLEEFVQSSLRVVFTLTFSYLGAIMALRGKDEFNIVIPYVRFRRQDSGEDTILLDTSAIIDGRITDIYKAKFCSGRLIVPRFVLRELQRIADSEDGLKRARGRRGLDILRSMQKDSAINLTIHEEDIPGEEDVDTQLVRLAKVLDSRICTTDFNLNRTASIQGIEILNLHELVQAIKPVVLPGEFMDVHLVKEGKEPNQAVGYMDDGTMIVVKDARPMIGQKVRVAIDSVLQTEAGQMIFAQVKK